MAGAKKAAASHAPAPKPGVVTDGASALKDMTQLLGAPPEFLKRFPEAARAGAWREFRDVELNPRARCSNKLKELTGLAVAAQIPCRYCVIAHTEFAKLAGATDAEINEAIGMAALTRNLSTMLNGLQVDEVQFRQGRRQAGQERHRRRRRKEAPHHRLALTRAAPDRIRPKRRPAPLRPFCVFLSVTQRAGPAAAP